MAAIVPFDDPTNYSRVKQRLKRLWDGGLFQILQHAQDRWRYKVEGLSVDGRRMSCVVEIDGRLIVITVIAAKGRNVRPT